MSKAGKRAKQEVSRADVIKMGIGDVTKPLVPAVTLITQQSLMLADKAG